MSVNLIKLEARGRKRAQANNALLGSGQNSLDTFNVTSEGIAIGNPWKSECGRFNVDPYKEYGRAFVVWLLSESK